MTYLQARSYFYFSNIKFSYINISILPPQIKLISIKGYLHLCCVKCEYKQLHYINPYNRIF